MKLLNIRLSLRSGVILLLILLAGLLLVLACPPYSIAGVWLVVLLPIWLLLDLVFQKETEVWVGLGGRLWRSWLCMLPVGMIFVFFNAEWLVHSAHIFGGLPFFLAKLVVCLGGLLMSLQLWMYFGLPFALFWSRGRVIWWAIPIWVIGIQQLSSGWFVWSPGYLMHTVPQLVQSQRWLGTEGLDAVFLGWQLWLYLMVRWWWKEKSTPPKPPVLPLVLMGSALAGVLLLLAADGELVLRRTATAPEHDDSAKLQLVGLQPNLSLAHLTSNPELLPQARFQNLTELVADSEGAVQLTRQEASGENPPSTELLVWPESVFGPWYFLNRSGREQMENLARRLKINIILSTMHADLGKTKADNRYYGSAVHVLPNGETGERYDKISLMPFGETIPFADYFPAWGKLVKKLVPEISNFEAGKEYTVFRLTDRIRVAPIICFDLTNRGVAMGMVGSGANVIVVMANLAWFGDTGLSRLMELFIRMRAAETGLPVVLLSQNGESLVVDAQGRRVTEILPVYTEGVLRAQLSLPERASFYARHRQWWSRLSLIAWLLLLGWMGSGWVRCYYARWKE